MHVSVKVNIINITNFKFISQRLSLLQKNMNLKQIFAIFFIYM